MNGKPNSPTKMKAQSVPGKFQLLVNEGDFMIDLKKFNAQYITNESGERISVVLSLESFQELVEDIEDLAAVAERREEPTISHEQLIKDLKTDGLL